MGTHTTDSDMTTAERTITTERMNACTTYAVQYKLEGAMKASSHGYHPRMVLRGNILLVNEWSTDGRCGIYVLPDGVKMTKPPLDEPRAHCDPWPEFDGHRGRGNLLQVWHHGSWILHGPWNEAVESMLDRLEREISIAREDEAIRTLEATEKADRERRDKVFSAGQAFAAMSDDAWIRALNAAMPNLGWKRVEDPDLSEYPEFTATLRGLQFFVSQGPGGTCIMVGDSKKHVKEKLNPEQAAVMCARFISDEADRWQTIITTMRLAARLW